MQDPRLRSVPAQDKDTAATPLRHGPCEEQQGPRLRSAIHGAWPRRPWRGLNRSAPTSKATHRVAMEDTTPTHRLAIARCRRPRSLRTRPLLIPLARDRAFAQLRLRLRLDPTRPTRSLRACFLLIPLAKNHAFAQSRLGLRALVGSRPLREPLAVIDRRCFFSLCLPVLVASSRVGAEPHTAAVPLVYARSARL